MQCLRLAVVVMSGFVSGCGPLEGTDFDPVNDDSTSGGTTTAPGGVGSTSEAGESSSSGEGTMAIGSTATDTDTDTDTDSDSDSDSDSDTDTDGEPSQACTSTACTTTCVQPFEVDNGAGEVCECDRADYPDDYTRCDLGNRCGDDRLCIVQAVRYGVVGTYRLDDFAGEDQFTLVIDVLGEGRARAHATGWTHDCCGGTDVNEFGTFHHPQVVVDPDNPMWRECIRFHAPEFEEIPECLLPENMFAGSCEPPLLECPPLPEPPDPEGTCPTTCPMMHDDVCDEVSGTGLCSDGCDLIDCTCTADVPSECDAAYGDPSCPLASDPDCR
jgi:hypothetical protein